MKQAFEDADEDGSGTLDLEEFKNVFRFFIGLRGVSDQDMTALFMKIDSSSDGEINWDEFCTYMQLEYAEKEESYFRAKETAFYLPATQESSPHRDTIMQITHTIDNTYLAIGQDGMVSFWSSKLDFRRTKQIESGTKKSKWITDFVLMPQYNKFIIATGDRELQFHELSSFEAYCQISSLETVPLKLSYCFTGSDDCILMYGDSQGCITIFILSSVGELLRTWKKMPKVDGIASISIDSVTSNENVKFVRWKVHNDWVQELRYYHSIRCVISCSTDSNHSLVIGQTTGSTHLESSMKDTKKLTITPSNTDMALRRRLPSDETVFKIYKGVKAFDFCKIKNILVTGGMDRLVRLWNPYVPTKPIGILRGHVTPIFYLFIVAEDNRLFSISNEKTVKVWDINDQACLLTVRPKSHLIKGDLSSVHFNPVSRGLVLATDHIALLALKNKPLSMQMTTSHKEGVTCCRYNRSFGHITTASTAGVVKVWDLTDGSEVFEYSKAHNDSEITCMSFDSTERRLLTGGQDGRVKIWNYNNGHCITTLETGTKMDEVTALVYFTLNKNRYIISVGWDRCINIFSDDSQDYHHVQHPCIEWPDDAQGHGHKEDILCVEYMPPTFLATSSYDGEVLIWNCTSGRVFCRLHSSLTKDTADNDVLEGGLAVGQLCYLRSRMTNRRAASLITNGPKAAIHFWNVYDHDTEYAMFPAPHGMISSMKVNESSSLLFAADVKGFVTVWKVAKYCLNGKEKRAPEVEAAWRAHVAPITCMELVEEHKTIITTSSDCTVRLWTFEGHFIGSLGQPNKWNIHAKDTYQHPMAPYDVLVDPESIPSHPVFENVSTSSDEEESEDVPDVKEDVKLPPIQKALPTKPTPSRQKMTETVNIETLLQLDPAKQGAGKRLRHARLHRNSQVRNDPGGYKTLKCFELEDVPNLPDQPVAHEDPYKHLFN